MKTQPSHPWALPVPALVLMWPSGVWPHAEQCPEHSPALLDTTVSLGLLGKFWKGA